MNRDKAKRQVKTLLNHGLLLIIGLAWIYPFLWMISASFKDQNEFFKNKLGLIPQNPTFDLPCREVFARGQKEIMSSIAIPLVSTIIPTYEVIKSMKLVGTKLGLILAQAGGAHVIFLLLFSSFFEQIPGELEEAAKVDGCNFFRTFFNIMMPLTKPIATTVVIMETIWAWNAFMLPLVLTLNNPSSRTLAVGLYAFKGENTVDWTGIAAGGVIAVIPIILLFICLQKYFVEGIAGAVKS